MAHYRWHTAAVLSGTSDGDIATPRSWLCCARWVAHSDDNASDASAAVRSPHVPEIPGWAALAFCHQEVRGEVALHSGREIQARTPSGTTSMKALFSSYTRISPPFSLRRVTHRDKKFKNPGRHELEAGRCREGGLSSGHPLCIPATR